MNGYGEQRTNHDMFNRMHNHATWATAAVGMTGFATGNKQREQKRDLQADQCFGEPTS